MPKAARSIELAQCGNGRWVGTLDMTLVKNEGRSFGGSPCDEFEASTSCRSMNLSYISKSVAHNCDELVLAAVCIKQLGNYQFCSSDRFDKGKQLLGSKERDIAEGK